MQTLVRALKSNTTGSGFQNSTWGDVQRTGYSTVAGQGALAAMLLQYFKKQHLLITTQIAKKLGHCYHIMHLKANLF